MKTFYKIITIALLAFLALPLWGENSITAKMELYNSIGRLKADNWYSTGIGIASIIINQKDNRNVKSQIKLSAVMPDPRGTNPIYFDLPRAYVKFRFPKIRAVIGKAPFSWGEGLVFNAGDVIFGSSALNTNLMQSEFLDTATWLTTLYYPLGNFSYLETIVISPDIMSEGIDITMGGGRVVTKLGNTKLESGYIYDGLKDAHKPYITLQGNLYLDWHLSATAALPTGNVLINSFEESLVITAGIYSLARIGYDGTLSYRFEAMIKPYEKWSEYSAGTESYGIYLYPELSYSFNSGMALILRSFVSPVDLSAVAIPGFSWNVFQGFNLIGFAAFYIGDPDDTYAWEPETSAGGFALMAGVSVTY
ncbi:hypothetical protein ES705_25102 [subsurface metagenome]